MFMSPPLQSIIPFCSALDYGGTELYIQKVAVVVRKVGMGDSAEGCGVKKAEKRRNDILIGCVEVRWFIAVVAAAVPAFYLQV
eukprot:scaffold5665_cov92-Skeletonema_dohrnii-CCMP3373.AAC.6